MAVKRGIPSGIGMAMLATASIVIAAVAIAMLAAGSIVVRPAFANSAPDERAALLQPTPFQTPTPNADGAILYTVLAGDTLWRIAAIAEISVEELMALNGIQSGDFISPGMELVLGSLAATPVLLTGSYVTRSGASLACLDFPLCGAVEQATQRLVDIHMLHRLAAFAVAGLVIAVVIWMFRRTQDQGLRRFAIVLTGLVVIQFGLGIANVFFLLPMWSRVLHITVGASFWSALVILWSVTRRSGVLGAELPPASI